MAIFDKLVKANIINHNSNSAKFAIREGGFSSCMYVMNTQISTATSVANTSARGNFTTATPTLFKKNSAQLALFFHLLLSGPSAASGRQSLMNVHDTTIHHFFHP